LGPDRFSAAEQWWRAVLNQASVSGPAEVPGQGPLAFGAFAFADNSPQASSLIVPQVVVARFRGREWVTTAEAPGQASDQTSWPLDDAVPAPPARRAPRFGGGAAAEPGSVTAAADRARRHGVTNWPTSGRALARAGFSTGEPTSLADGGLVEEPGPVAAADWPATVAKAVALIKAGAMEKVVLARSVIAHSTGGAIDTLGLARNLAAAYGETWTFAVDGIVGATPELLLRSSRGLVTSRVLAGTIRRGGCDQADLAHAAALARSSKDLEEHEFAVRSVTQALEPFLEEISVPETPSVLHLPNVMHLATEVVGELRRSRAGALPGALSLVEALHPSAAVCGTPKRAAAEAIVRLEGLDRGRYSGPVGWIDQDGAGEWGIALRCAELDADRRRARLWAGGGIVAASDPAAELAETEAKLQPMRGALGLIRTDPEGP
jgi:menaquinone-specific isochorismate synthase